MDQFLKSSKTSIRKQGKPVTLKGVNLGGWLMPEAYLVHAPSVGVWQFRKNFEKKHGRKKLDVLEDAFRRNWVKESDIQNIRRLGFNCIRVPFHYRLIETAPYRYSPQGVLWLDRVIQWAKKAGLWTILDFHGAPGSQNLDWHSDSAGKALLWTRKDFQRRSRALWEFLADRYKDEPSIAGYDLLNEAVLKDTRLLNSFYRELIQGIRLVDKNHLLFIEGNTWATNLDCLEEFDDDNYCYSIHSYEPMAFTFNFDVTLRYPYQLKDKFSNFQTSRRHLGQYQKIAEKRKVPVYVGEFGVNYRFGSGGEDRYLQDVLKLFDQFGFHWTYWTYKAVKNAYFPDGLYGYYDNPPWVNRSGPLTGWDTWHLHWEKRKEEMVHSWQTEQFKPNAAVIKVLKNAL